MKMHFKVFKNMYFCKSYNNLYLGILFLKIGDCLELKTTEIGNNFAKGNIVSDTILHTGTNVTDNFFKYR